MNSPRTEKILKNYGFLDTKNWPVLKVTWLQSWEFEAWRLIQFLFLKTIKLLEITWKKENLAFSCLIWWSSHIGNLRGGRNGTARSFYFDIWPSDLHGGNNGCYTCLHGWPERLKEKQSNTQSKLLMSLQSSIFRIKAFYGHISCTLLILQTVLVPLR